MPHGGKEEAMPPYVLCSQKIPGRELFGLPLITEADFQEFALRVIDAVGELGGSRLDAASGLFDISRQLRKEGAGAGGATYVSVLLCGKSLQICWGDEKHRARLMTLPHRPETALVEELAQRLSLATRSIDAERLRVRNHEMMKRFEETRRKLRSELSAMQAALDLRQAELRESLRLAEADPLTGLLNRRAFDARFPSVFRRTLRQQNEHLTLLLLDLDDFKRINDEHGHQYGDAYLKRMAQTMLAAVRADVDSVFRFGGDEFAILMCADRFAACRRAMQILESMDKRVSIGAASITGANGFAGEPEELFAAADDALYASKHAGRGRVTFEDCRRRDEVTGCNVPCEKVRGGGVT